MPCMHDWHTLGTGEGGRVVCMKCHRHGTVAVDPTPPSHLAKARVAWNKSTEPWQTPTDSAGFRADALGEVIAHLEAEQDSQKRGH